MAPDYKRPDPPVPANWPTGEAYKPAVSDPALKPASEIPWQEYIVEPRLLKVVDLALKNNRDLRIAILTIEKTRALYQVQRADLFPQIDGTAGASIQRQPADLAPSGQAKINRQYNVGLGISSYELDLFGRVRSLKDQALEQYLATEEARRTVQVTLIAEVANAWLNVAADREKLQLARETLTNQQDYFRIMKRRFDSGIISALDLYEAQTALDSARVDIALYTSRLAQSQNSLNLLAGSSVPVELLPEALIIVTAIKEPAPGIPSELLLNRPDLLQAEHRLKGYNANIGAARAAFFPKISLTSTIGTASVKLTDLFQPGSLAWSFVPQISVPLFDAGSNIANLDVAKAERDIALAQYEKAIQTAFREVADALAQRGTIDDQLSAQQSLTDTTAESHKLSKTRYDKGVDSYLAVIISQRSLYNTQQNLINVKLLQLINRITLYKVLGGGAKG